VPWLLHVSGKGVGGLTSGGGGGFPSTGKIKDIIGTRGLHVGLGTKLANTDVSLAPSRLVQRCNGITAPG
jgi:hypothetical protein